MKRTSDGSAGDVDYGKFGRTYAMYRRPDPAIAAQIERALGSAQTVLNVGAGAGSYEPSDRLVTAVEPSASMRAQRPESLPQAIDGYAEALPFSDDSFDASMSTVSIHQWADLERGLTEMRRVTRGRIVLLVCDPARMHDYWLSEYIPEVRENEARRFPPIHRISKALAGQIEIQNVPVPLNCTDGFNEAYYGRPEAFLDADARLACSSWSAIDDEILERFVAHLSTDLKSGLWDKKYGHLRTQPYFDGPLRLIIASPD